MKRLVACELGCGLLLKVDVWPKVIKGHQSNICMWRPVPCDYECDTPLLEKDRSGPSKWAVPFSGKVFSTHGCLITSASLHSFFLDSSRLPPWLSVHPHLPSLLNFFLFLHLSLYSCLPKHPTIRTPSSFDRLEHLKVCLRRPIPPMPCDLGCGFGFEGGSDRLLEIEAERNEHEIYLCPNRVTKCTFVDNLRGVEAVTCGKEIMAKFRRTHRRHHFERFGIVTYSVAGEYTYRVPKKRTELRVQMWGAGGASGHIMDGRYVHAMQRRGAGGGGSGGHLGTPRMESPAQACSHSAAALFPLPFFLAFNLSPHPSSYPPSCRYGHGGAGGYVEAIIAVHPFEELLLTIGSGGQSGGYGVQTNSENVATEVSALAYHRPLYCLFYPLHLGPCHKHHRLLAGMWPRRPAP